MPNVPPNPFDAPSSNVPPNPFDTPPDGIERYDRETNSLLKVPADFNEEATNREAVAQKAEQPINPVLDFLDAPGGIARVSDPLLAIGGIEEAAVNLATGLPRQKIEVELEKVPFSPEEAARTGQMFGEKINESLGWLSQGDWLKAGTALVEAMSVSRRMRGATSPFAFTGEFTEEQKASARGISDTLLNIQKNNREMLVRNNLLNGPDDEPTVLGNAAQSFGPSIAAMGVAYVMKNPIVAGGLFFGMQQEEGFRSAEEKGKSAIEAQTGATIAATPELVFSTIGAGVIFKKIDDVASSVLSKTVFSAAIGAAEEGATDSSIAALEELVGFEDRTFGEIVMIGAKAAAYGSIVEGTTGGTLAFGKRILDTVGIDPDTQKQMVDAVIDETNKAIASEAQADQAIIKDSMKESPATETGKAAKTSADQVRELQEAFDEGDIDKMKATADKLFPQQREARELAKVEERGAEQAQQAQERAEKGRRREISQKLTKALAVEEDLAQEFDEAFREIADEFVSKETDQSAVDRLGAIISESGEVLDTDALTEFVSDPDGFNKAVAESPALSRIRKKIEQNQETIEALHEEEAGLVFQDERTQEAVKDKDIRLRASEIFRVAEQGVRSSIQAFRAGIKTGTADTKRLTKALQKEVKNIIDSLPVTDKVKNRLLKRIPNINSVATAESTLKKIIQTGREQAFKQSVKDTQARIKDAIKKNVGKLSEKAKLAVDYQNTVDKLKQSKAQLKEHGIHKAIQNVYDSTGGGIPSAGHMMQIRHLHILQDGKAVDPIELAEFADDLDAFIATGKGVASIANAFEQAELDAEIQNIETSAVTSSRAGLEKEWQVATDKAYRFFGHTFETLLKIVGLDGTWFNFKREDRLFRERKEASNQTLNDITDDLTEGDGDQFRRDLGNGKGNVIDVPRNEFASPSLKPKRIKMSRGEMIYAWMLLQEPSLRKQIMDEKGDMGWTQEFVDLIQARMDQTDIDFAMRLFKEYEKSYAEFNEAYRELNNRDLPKVEFYSHINRELDDTFDHSVYSNNPFMQEVVDAEEAGTAGEPSEAKTRTVSTKEIRIVNVLDAWERYHIDVQHYITQAKKLDKVFRLLNDDRVRDVLQDRMGKAGYETFIKHIEAQARRNLTHSYFFKIAGPIFERIRKNSFSAILTLNGKIGIGQMSSVFAGMDGISKGEGMASLFEYISDGKRIDKILNQHSTFEKRGQHYDPAVDQLGRAGRLMEMMRWPVRKGDSWAVKVVGWMRYKNATQKQGKSHEEALQEAADFVERSQQSTLNANMTLAQKSQDPLVRALVMWRSSITAMWNVSVQSIAEYQQADKSTPKKMADARKKVLETLMIQQFVIPATFGLATGSSWSSILTGSSGAIPFVGELVEMLMANLLNIFAEEDERVFTTGWLQIPLAEGAAGVATDAQRFLDNPSLEGFMNATATMVDVGTGKPASNILNAGDGVKQVTQTEDVLDGILKMLQFKEDARKKMLERLEAVTGEDLVPKRKGRRVVPAGI